MASQYVKAVGTKVSIEQYEELHDSALDMRYANFSEFLRELLVLGLETKKSKISTDVETSSVEKNVSTFTF